MDEMDEMDEDENSFIVETHDTLHRRCGSHQKPEEERDARRRIKELEISF